MLFNSLQFVIFFPLVTLLYFLLPYKFRWLHLLVASCIFYMAFVPVYILILFLTIIIDYIAGIIIEPAEGKRRQWFLAMSIVANVGLLAFFKYYNFFADNANVIFHAFHSTSSIPLLKIILPIGLSFHTFQAMSYTIEVYRGNQKAERHFGIYALYVMFYPQLVAGPIERPQNVLHQFHEKHDFSYTDAVQGFRLMLWGFFKKIVIADRIAVIIDPVYNNPAGYSATTILICIFLFGYEIYCDFSGYSDIALGSAQVMGYKLMVNFDHPFKSKSVTEFWRRWHISLSTWFNDYLFNPLVTGLRYWGKMGIVVGLFTTFFLSGLWHGAGWKFVIFGLLHGGALIYEYFTRKKRKKLFSKLPQSVNTGLSKVLTKVYVLFTWIFFRANNVADAFYIIRKLGAVPKEIHQVITTKKIAFLNLPGIMNALLPAFGFIFLLEFIYLITAKYDLSKTFSNKPLLFRWSAYFAALILIITCGVFEKHQFIYFQF